jgi:tyrosine-protein phosphatase YwqE
VLHNYRYHELNSDYDGLNELFDKGAYHKAEELHLKGILAGFTWRKLEPRIPLLIAILYAASGDYISLLRHIRMIV